MTKAFSTSQEEFIKEQIASGRYQSREELIAAAIDLLRDQERLHALKVAEYDAQILRGVGDAAVGRIKPGNEIFDRLLLKYSAMMEK